ncbi:unnamed protein product [Nyctereutes procyonoides]|uniref:(raccoon dog) hypothetical protein n=1 Tax=Nyctereutes procyonoides TaxID=34880 RepID=A0A811ZAZ0_NYCPR|nr:unnamed protein product [Nyctereutes procyonoides]
MAFWTHLMLLLWKNFLYRRRQPVQLLVELLWPLFLFFILVAVRHSHPPLEHHECKPPRDGVGGVGGQCPPVRRGPVSAEGTGGAPGESGRARCPGGGEPGGIQAPTPRVPTGHFANKPLPSAGTIPWLQGLVCTLNNTCFPQPTPAEQPGVLSNFKDSLVSRLLADAHTVLGGPSARRTLASLGKLMPTLSAAGRAARPQPSDPAQDRPHPELLGTLLGKESLGSVLGHAQESVANFVEAAEDLAQELLALPSLVELQALLRRPQGAGGPLEAVSEALCGARGPGIPGGPSLGWHEAGHLKELVGQEALPDSGLSPACAELVGTLETHPLSRLLWRRLKPLVLGKLLFTPDTAFTRQLMAQVNRTFQELALLKDIPEVWAALGPQLFRFLNDSSNVAMLQKLLQAQDRGRRQPGSRGQDPAKALLTFLDPRGDGYGWRDAHADVGHLVGLLGRVMECVTLDKLEAAPSEAALVARSLQLLSEQRFWAGVVFLGPEDPGDPAGPGGPGHVRMKIRMDIDAVTRTNKIRDRFWDPGPAADPLADLRYVWGGFVYLQDLLEGAAVRVLSGSEPRARLYLQQMPYPATWMMRERRLATHPPGTEVRWPRARPLPRVHVVKAAPAPHQDQSLWEERGSRGAGAGRGGAVACADTCGPRPERGAAHVQGPGCPAAAQRPPRRRFLRVLGRSLPLFLTLAWIYSVALAVKAVVREKETRLRATMRAMGLGAAALWLGWLLSGLGPFLLSSALLVLVLKLGDILPYSHPAVVFLFLAAFAVATVVQSFLLSALFSRANLAAACGGLAYFVLYLPYVLCVAWRDQLPAGGLAAASLLSPVAFGFGCESLALLEEQGEGAQWHNMGTAPAPEVFSLAWVSGVLLLDAALYGLATWYLEGVCPGQYGIPKPWTFPLQRSYWLGPRSPVASPPPPTPRDPEALTEEVPPGLTPGVSVRGLEKRFPGNPQPALRGLTLDFYEGHITALLGHNGAGKTTTLSILSGLFPPTGGSAYILGHDIQSSLAAVRPHLGVCPQYNVLFDLLTVDEHIWFYGRLKGLSAAAVRREQARLLQDVGLVPKRRAQTRHLSGGMQRKLSVAMAFVGGSRVVILDEPTAGVDPASRRSIWELLLKYREGRTLILSTHHLDEAEVLGDRVAVVAGGRVCCCGSPLFLRRHLGSGYYLTLVKSRPSPAAGGEGNADSEAATGPGREAEQAGQRSAAGAAQLLSFVQQLVPGARLVEELPHELLLVLPYGGAVDGSFARLFREMDRRLGELGLASYGISDTSLEEIFLKVMEDHAVDTDLEGHGRRQQPPSTGPDRTTRLKTVPEPRAQEDRELALSAPETQALQGSGPLATGRLRGWPLTCQQLCALLLKRFLLACRSRRGLFAQIVLPALFVGLALLFSLIVPPFGHYPALQLRPSMYGAQVSFFSEDAPGTSDQAHLLAMLLEEAGLGEGAHRQDGSASFPTPALKTKKWVNEVRYGGFSLGGRDPGLPSGQEVSRSVEELRALLSPPPGGALDRILNNLTAWARSLDAKDSLKIWFNNKGWHAMVAFVNRANNALLHARLPPGPPRHAHSITTVNHPLNLTKEQLSEAALMASSVDVLVSICVVFAMSFVPASFTLVLIEERVTRAKHLQFMGGLPPTLYWLSNFLWDMCNYLVSACIVVLIFLAFQQKAYVAPANLPALLLLLLLYGWSITPLMYPASFVFSVPSTAYVVLTCVNLFVGINGSMATFVLELFSDKKLQDVSRVLKQVFLVFPHFCLGRGLIDMVRNQAMADAFERLGDGQFQSPLRWEVVGKNLVCMAVQGPLFLLFTLLLQHCNRLLPQPRLRSLPPLGEEDEDVARERERVVHGATQEDVLVLRDLTKVYHGQRTPAVDRLCLGIPPGECFGLLGVNGAGKTSTFRMVTGDMLPSGGEAVLAGHSVAREPAAAHRHMGYCPQSDAVFELLTGREHLELFARLRGVPEAQVAQVTPHPAPQPALSPPAAHLRAPSAHTLRLPRRLEPPPAPPSPGLGPPPLGSAAGLTRGPGSMEECEALCTRLAILVDGRFRCLGSAQHLKSR